MKALARMTSLTPLALLVLSAAPGGCALEADDSGAPLDEEGAVNAELYLDDDDLSRERAVDAVAQASRDGVALACTQVPAPTPITATFLRCTGDGPEYRFSWNAVPNPSPCTGPVTYDFDYRYHEFWNDFFQNGNTSITMTAFTPFTLGVRVRACNQAGCSAFRTNAGSQRPGCGGGN